MCQTPQKTQCEVALKELPLACDITPCTPCSQRALRLRVPETLHEQRFEQRRSRAQYRRRRRLNRDVGERGTRGLPQGRLRGAMVIGLGG